VSLEAEFWQAFVEIASSKGKAINALASEIDVDRGKSSGLASAIRIYVLKHYQTAQSPNPAGD